MLTVNKSKTPKSQCPFLRGVNLHSLPQRRVEHTRDLIGFRGAIRWGCGTSVPPPTAQSLNDSYGNTGPTTTITYRFVIHQQQNQVVISPFYYVIAAVAIGGSLGTTVFLKRFNSTTGPFDDLFKLTGGEMQPPTTLMIV